MRIAILGATSQIAKDLVLSFCVQEYHDLVLYARRPDVVMQWLAGLGLSKRCASAEFSTFSVEEGFDAIINFVGVSNPAQAATMGASIFDVTQEYDQLALNYTGHHQQCRYIFISSGAVYGDSFDKPVDENSKAVVAINNLQQQDWYTVAKLNAECRHRALQYLPIIDVRVFNYFSRSQDLSARFFITDILRAIREGVIFKTTNDEIVRDFLNPIDFYHLIKVILSAPLKNLVLDAYSKAPISKFELLTAMNEKFGLSYEVAEKNDSINATGHKKSYYSLNKNAANLGYQPFLTSLEGIELEVSALMKQFGRSGTSAY